MFQLLAYTALQVVGRFDFWGLEINFKKVYILRLYNKGLVMETKKHGDVKDFNGESYVSSVALSASQKRLIFPLEIQFENVLKQ